MSYYDEDPKDFTKGFNQFIFWFVLILAVLWVVSGLPGHPQIATLQNKNGQTLEKPVYPLTGVQYDGCGPGQFMSVDATSTLFCVASPGAMPNLVAKLDATKHGTGNTRIAACLGDSTCFGVGASVAASPGVVFCADIATYYGVTCQWNSWFGGGNTGSGTYWQGDPRIVAGSGWAVDASVPTIGVDALSQSASGGALTFAPSSAQADTFEVYYIKQSGGGTLSLSLEDGTTATVNTSTTGTASMQKYVLTATSGVGMHTLSHAWVSGGKVDLVGDLAYDSTTSSVIVVLAGAGGSTSGQWSVISQPYAPGNAAPYATIGVDAAVVEAGLINDWFNYPSAATSQANIQTLVNALETAGADVALYTPVPSNPTSGKTLAQQTAFVNAMRAVANANHNANTASKLPVIDNFTQWGSYASHPSRYADGAVHPNATGYQINAQAIETALVQKAAQSAGFNPNPWIVGTGKTQLSSSIVSSGTYSVTGSEGIIFCGGATLSFPATVADGYQVEIYSLGSAVCTLTYSGATNNPPPSLIGGSGLILENNGANWWPVARSGPWGSSQALVLNCTVDSAGSYTANGSEGCILANAGTLTLPSLTSSLYNGFSTQIVNYSGSNNLTVTVSGATNKNVPATVSPLASVTVLFYSNTWYLVSSTNPGIFSGTSASIGGSSVAAGACVSGNVTVTGVSSFTQVPVASPVTFGAPGSTFLWRSYIVSANTVGIDVCNFGSSSATPTASTYAVRVIN